MQAASVQAVATSRTVTIWVVFHLLHVQVVFAEMDKGLVELTIISKTATMLVHC